MKFLKRLIEKWIDNIRLRTKLMGLYLLCILLPLALTDGVILYSMISFENERRQHEVSNMASSVQYTLTSMLDYSSSLAQSIYINTQVEDFLNTRFKSPYDYYDMYYRFVNESFFKSLTGLENSKVTVYADNETIIDGGEFAKLSSVEDSIWYQELEKTEEDIMVLFFYDDWKSPYVQPKRKIVFARRLDFMNKDACEKVLKIEIDYSSVVNKFTSMKYEMPIYICQNGRVILTNEGTNNASQDFIIFDQYDQVAHTKTITLYDEELQIYIMKEENTVATVVARNYRWILLMLAINIVVPFIVVQLIERSLVGRIRELSRAFESVNKDELIKLRNARGEDEIGSLMFNYNRMVDRTNELIQTVYKDRLKEQESNIARKNAELQALHSQINPHFLFNALESIRMHSIIKKEFETAEMVEKLAIMERQNVDWDSDMVEISREIQLVEAYLGLQKYRFGDRLNYELDIDEDCRNLRIPKLSVTTFVENACVHGMESKTAPGWIFVRIYKEENQLCLEVEDTGGGMDEVTLLELTEKMQTVTMEDIKRRKHVGILNACLRIQMVTDYAATFAIESEEGVGTMIQIRIPIADPEVGEEHNNNAESAVSG